MSKRLLTIFVALVLVVTVTLAGCSQQPVSPVDNDNQDEVVDGEQGDKDDVNTNPEDNEEEDNNQEDNDQEGNDQEQQEPDEKDNEDEQEDIVYISAAKLNVRAGNSTDSEIIGSFRKGKAVRVIGALKDESGEATWYKTEFESVENNNEGWISAKYTVKDRMDLLGEDYKELDLSPQDKVVEYPGNPRVEVKGIYLTIYSAANALGRLDDLIEISKETKINTFVIDVKDDYGTMLFPTESAERFDTNANAKATVKDIEALMKKLKDNNIYTIARIVSFKDPKYAARYPEKAITYKSNGQPFTNSDGIVWLSAHDRQLWEYNIEVAKEAAKVGFNEIQFDYVRFPASNGGKLDQYVDYKNELNESKPVTIQKYLKYAREELSPYNVYISADIYGQVGSVAGDMGLGQYWEAVSNVVDYVSPMMYPSHYGEGVYGLSVPDAYPYETIDRGVKDALERNKNIETPAIIRPWIQDFTATWVDGYIRYGVKEVKAQIEALEANGVNEFLLWNPSNKYTTDALK